MDELWQCESADSASTTCAIDEHPEPRNALPLILPSFTRVGQRLFQLSRTHAARTTAWRALGENISRDVHALSLESALPQRIHRREHRGPWIRSVSDSNMLDYDSPTTSPRNALRHVVGILTELGSKDERDSDVDKTPKHAASEFSVEDAGFLPDISSELFVPRQAFSSFNSETATPSITPMIACRSVIDSESDEHTKTPPTPPIMPRMPC